MDSAQTVKRQNQSMSGSFTSDTDRINQRTKIAVGVSVEKNVAFLKKKKLQLPLCGKKNSKQHMVQILWKLKPHLKCHTAMKFNTHSIVEEHLCLDSVLSK